VRDVRRIVEIGFPVFAAGMRPVDSRGRSVVLDYDVSIMCAGVHVRTGDIVFGDVDGVAIIPKEVAEETVARALEKVRREDESRADLQAGAYLRDVFARHGVL
jgi:4-hydroxy-4-methyl-2-oxoglutarate aldolase